MLLVGEPFAGGKMIQKASMRVAETEALKAEGCLSECSLWKMGRTHRQRLVTAAVTVRGHP